MTPNATGVVVCLLLSFTLKFLHDQRTSSADYCIRARGIPQDSSKYPSCIFIPSMRSTLLFISLLAVLPFTSAVPGTTFHDRVTSSQGHHFKRSGCYLLSALTEFSPPLSAVTVQACINACDSGSKHYRYGGVGNNGCFCGNSIEGGTSYFQPDDFCKALTCKTGGGEQEYLEEYCGSDVTLVLYSST